MENVSLFFRGEKSCYGSGKVPRKHAAFAPASQKRLDSRLRSPLPSVEEPCPLSLPYGFLSTQPDPAHHRVTDAFMENYEFF